MVDEIALALLFCFINPERVEYLIMIGDDKQLPPIGVGRPFIDTIYYLQNKNLTQNYQHLTINLRFPSAFDNASKLENLAEVLRAEEEPLIEDFTRIFNQKDDTLTVIDFNSEDELEQELKKILIDIIGSKNKNLSLKDLFYLVIEPKGEFDFANLEKIQILTPRRIGKFGSIFVNRKAILGLGDQSKIYPGTKIICEDNQYWRINKKRVLGLANGSLGYLDSKGHYLKFPDVSELYNLYTGNGAAINQITENIRSVKDEITNQSSSKDSNDSSFSPAYAITVHKSQGSDFDYLILILSDYSSFVTRELLYTAFTRSKRKVFLFVYKDLKEEFLKFLISSYRNSSTDKIKTLLFGHKKSPFRPFIVNLKKGSTIAVASKIEYMIAKALDEMDVSFEYEPEDFYIDYGFKPDLKSLLEKRSSSGNISIGYIKSPIRIDGIGRKRYIVI
jgi:exodeoxyribonuclease V alpha subunit